MGIVITILFAILVLSSINRFIKRHVYETDADNTTETPAGDSPWIMHDNRDDREDADPEEVIVNYDRQAINATKQHTAASVPQQPNNNTGKRFHKDNKTRLPDRDTDKNPEQAQPVLEDFDARKAIIYAEIMKPKYKEY